MDFKSKTVEEVLVWLEKKGYDEWVREIFEGLCCWSHVGREDACQHRCLYNKLLFNAIENEVDGQAFLLLTKKNMK